MTEAPVPGDERKWAAIAHLAALAGVIVPMGGAVLGPLIVWYMKKEQMPFVADQAREALNFQLTVFIASFIGLLLIFIGIGVLVLLLLFLADLVLIWIATFNASEGVAYRYPVNLRLVKN